MKNFALACATLALGLSTASIALAQPGAPPRPMRRDRDDRRERHPELRRALSALESARTDLQRGSHDFGGHRVKALAATQRAIAEIHQALQYDKE